MVSGKFTVTYGHDNEFSGELTPLQVAEIVANAYGFIDLDFEPNDRGWKVTATGKNRSLTVNGPTMDTAVERLLEKFE